MSSPKAAAAAEPSLAAVAEGSEGAEAAAGGAAAEDSAPAEGSAPAPASSRAPSSRPNTQRKSLDQKRQESILIGSVSGWHVADASQPVAALEFVQTLQQALKPFLILKGT